MEIYYIEAGVLERMLTCFENLSTHVTDCMREQGQIVAKKRISKRYKRLRKYYKRIFVL